MHRDKTKLPIYRIVKMLAALYGNPRHGNKLNPLDKLIYIILSNRTQPSAHRTVYRALNRAYRSWSLLRLNQLDNVEAILRPGGFSHLRSAQIVHILEHVRARFGRTTLSPLRRMTDPQAEDFLMSLPGVSKKVAKCVLMYSLQRQVLPVDVHVHRLTTRLGISTKKRPDTSPVQFSHLHCGSPLSDGARDRRAQSYSRRSRSRRCCIWWSPMSRLLPNRAQDTG